MNDTDLDALESAMNAWENDEDPSTVHKDVHSTPFLYLRSTMVGASQPQGHAAMMHAKPSSDGAHLNEGDIVGYVQRQTARESKMRPTQREIMATKKKVYGYQEPTLFERRRPQRRLPALEERHQQGGWDASITPDGLFEKRGQPKSSGRTVSTAPTKQPALARMIARDANVTNARKHELGGQKQLKPIAHNLTSSSHLISTPEKRPVCFSAPLAPTTTSSQDGGITSGGSTVTTPPVIGKPPLPPILSADPSTISNVDPSAQLVSTLQAELRVKLEEMTEVKGEKSNWIKRQQQYDGDVERLTVEAAAQRAHLLQLEKKLVKAREVKKELGQLLAAKRTKECQVADLKALLKSAVQRIASEKDEPSAVSKAPNRSGASTASKDDCDDGNIADNEDPAMTERVALSQTKNIQKQISTLKVKHEELLDRQKKLVAEKSKYAAASKTVEAKRKVEIDRLNKQREEVAKEIERKAKLEFEQAKQHLLANHEKGMRHRERECGTALEIETSRHKDLLDAVDKGHQIIKMQTKTIKDLSNTEAALRVHVRDSDARLCDAESATNAAKATRDDLKRQYDALGKKLEAMLVERRVVTEKLSNPQEIAAVQSVHESERSEWMADIHKAQSTQNELLALVAAKERQLQSPESLYPRDAAADLSKPLPKAIAELRLRLQNGETELARLAQLIEETRADADQRKKELVKARKQQSLTQDKQIEELTRELTALRESYKKLSKDNSQLETSLDVCERMISMNNLRHRGGA